MPVKMSGAKNVVLSFDQTPKCAATGASILAQLFHRAFNTFSANPLLLPRTGRLQRPMDYDTTSKTIRGYNNELKAERRTLIQAGEFDPSAAASGSGVVDDSGEDED